MISRVWGYVGPINENKAIIALQYFILEYLKYSSNLLNSHSKESRDIQMAN